ncbi:3-hydroxyisobutyrate dehydrogenase [Mycoplana sp. BE70]|uniref:NAD(P)-dependent oxidoreductase n=1 Tax=Mycoplana sp. BE70 TaxID=2817775 RepID=UPI002863B15E|nr:NAD(P)-dependent oxidoreductase [Mycoplana sp. BE70]MDR6755409.1 3-hydroxyisobutyrate dehydrogenase [Mycoplana sp. BE70]
MTSSGNAQPKVGFIGLGNMGRYMAGHILATGCELHIHSRTQSRALPLIEAGAIWHDHPGAVAAVSDVLITIVGYPADVEAIYLGADGIVDRARPGTVLIDMTTSSPALAVRIADAASKRGIAALDAPVSGGDIGARDAKLAVMVGGDETAFDQVLPLLQAIGSNIVRMGAAGTGQHTKMANQIAIASTMVAVAESVTYANRAGLNPDLVLEVIGTGAASSFLLNGLGRKMIREDFAAGFFVHHFAKDMKIALDEAARMGLDLPGLALAHALYDKLMEGGFGEEGTQALCRVYYMLHLDSHVTRAPPT